MLMTAGDSPVPATNYETAIALRGMALLQPISLNICWRPKLPYYCIICRMSASACSLPRCGTPEHVLLKP